MFRFSKEDQVELSAQLAPLLIKELKSTIKKEILEVREEIGEKVKHECQELRNEVSSLKTETKRLNTELNLSPR